ncbi:tRNA pseudouridine32 synthase/23S rRNA pseudouridine746 synthase [Lewinella aquimaris]|uniref:tRNA pseudouridine32 synthase/23S rRNA pseudouridine746 synthase n=1 Tax=Neolewinella aquimaris TaxID=1835722 RepID=A0A840DYF5_9BACT|nr:RluA family pseudouridine synthase [Neolewinella aquimaris]MBB4077950.1 tRNA pseudouridine32 synthase/23S rRNA pseudouridine746 synthase [Neolewinella aquimaris]
MPTFDTLLHPLPATEQLPAPPPRFNFPFHYRPHALALLAAADLQRHLSDGERNWEHDFGLTSSDMGGCGKMFGVLVVRDREGDLYYLAAYSGKLADSNDLPGFVPPVFDLLDSEGFYKRGEAEINRVSDAIAVLETCPAYAEAKREYAAAVDTAANSLQQERRNIKRAKENRRSLREAAVSQTSEAQAALEFTLSQESIRLSYGLKDLKRAVEHQVELKKKKLDEYTHELVTLRDRRSEMSASLQRRIFERYTFLNADLELRDLASIFAQTVFLTPPAGAGECAAPKLLQFAYLHGLEPVTMAEFWWGQSPASEIRKHGHFYPACRGKCEPILTHMLQGLDVDPNPLLENPAVGKKLSILYEDDLLLVVNKPSEFLSVPGKHIEDSVWLRIKKMYPMATGPLIVHRLDMSTSGLMLVTKTKEAHKLLQRQFFRRTVKKRYAALLAGEVAGDRGTIDLPLRGDLTDRPRQIVCADHGKNARSEWEVIERREGRTLVHMWPVTGRTHQLRVHAAHPGGLNCPIVGDDLYGQADDRLHLHAEAIQFVHPTTKETLSFEVTERFT